MNDTKTSVFISYLMNHYIFAHYYKQNKLIYSNTYIPIEIQQNKSQKTIKIKFILVA